jgi:hypothetical protein
MATNEPSADARRLFVELVQQAPLPVAERDTLVAQLQAGAWTEEIREKLARVCEMLEGVQDLVLVQLRDARQRGEAMLAVQAEGLDEDDVRLQRRDAIDAELALLLGDADTLQEVRQQVAQKS